MTDSCTNPAPKYNFGYWPNQSKVFRVVACYQEVAHHCKNWDPVYCSSLLIYCVAAIVNEFLLSYVLYYYVKSNQQGFILARQKTLIIILCMLMYFCDFLRNFLNDIPWKISLGLLYCEQICRFVIYTLVCHFFLKAAASLVGKGTVKQWRNYMNIFTAVVFSFWTLLGIYYLIRGLTQTGS